MKFSKQNQKLILFKPFHVDIWEKHAPSPQWHLL